MSRHPMLQYGITPAHPIDPTRPAMSAALNILDAHVAAVAYTGNQRSASTCQLVGYALIHP
jgi:hypothetical protein